MNAISKLNCLFSRFSSFFCPIHSFPSVFPFSLLNMFNLKFKCTRCTWPIPCRISHIATLRLNDRLNKKHKYLGSVNIQSECRKDHSYVIKIPHSIFDDDDNLRMIVFGSEIKRKYQLSRWIGSYMFYDLCSFHFSIDPFQSYIWMKYC